MAAPGWPVLPAYPFKVSQSLHKILLADDFRQCRHVTEFFQQITTDGAGSDISGVYPRCRYRIAAASSLLLRIMFLTSSILTTSFACVPRGVTSVQIVRVIQKYLAENPGKARRPTRYIASLAMAGAFPCKEGSKVEIRN